MLACGMKGEEERRLSRQLQPTWLKMFTPYAFPVELLRINADFVLVHEPMKPLARVYRFY